MSRNRMLTILLCGSMLLFLEFAAAAPPDAGDTKPKKDVSGKAEKSGKAGSSKKAGKADEPAAADDDSKPEKVVKTDAEWRKLLTPMQFKVTRKKFTEQPGSNPMSHYKKDGVYHCVCCGEPLFDSKTKFDSGTGWPSFYQVIQEQAVTEVEDTSGAELRTEVECSRCDAHLGHVFSDGPAPTGLRYCMNGAALKFVDRKKEQAAKEAKPASAKGAKKSEEKSKPAKTDKEKEATD